MKRHQSKTLGFTLVELLIVIAIISIITAIAVPNLMNARLSSNEAAAISLLRSLSSVQIQVANRKFIDMDADGIGEYGFFGELSGAIQPRAIPGGALLPPLLVGSFRQVNNGIVTRQGFHFVVYLPDVNTLGLAETPANYPLVDPNAAESLWCAYAWPADFGSSGRRAYFINHVGEVLKTDNSVQNYNGTVTIPPPDAAYMVAGSIDGLYRPGQVASDGGTWTVLQ
ncbi:MAG: prepilin-type N-terminal cleavage/methylation domain-containing protein [Planctomycetes bacterium]|nr:prepilin-type N-terminal cleavage/methylation domain-containing protein [Planctomycetota bacterium]